MLGTSVPSQDGSRRLNCLIEGESIVFPVTLGRDRVVANLKKEIKMERALDTLKDVHLLELWKVDIDLETHDKHSRSNIRLGDVEELESWKTILHYWPDQPPKDHLHIIVKVPVGKRKNEVERWRSKRIKSELPTIVELARIVDLPLSDDEKIPIPLETMKALVSSSIEMQDVCTMSDVELLFRPGSSNPAFYKIFSAVADAPPTTGTETSFIQFWDNNVRFLLELLVPGGRSIRNSNQHTATGSLRPDYAFIVSKLCTFRGEEKAPDNNDDPRKGLSDKIVWAYTPAPYVLESITVITVAGSSVIKAYNSLDKVERVNHLRKVYYLLQDKRVPHVDRLVRHFDTTVILFPRGISAPPTNEQELLAALICILEALEVNDPQRWIIIDWEDAAVPPTKAASHFNRSTHSPRVFEDGHGAEVDMWSVGELIVKCGALDVSSELVELGRWMQDAGPSASEALGEIKKYKLCRASVRGAASKGLLRNT
ncbi:hypothetical protein JOM56_011500 [Amanita muscaria]